MADLKINMAGIESPNPFWLASAPPTNTGEQVMRAFDAGWGGAVWKTLGDPIRNVSSRYAAMDYHTTRMMGLNNIELITDRPLEVNFREISEVKKRFPKHAVLASLMVETKQEWQDIIKRSIDAGADGLELNFGCPHGMCERGMGSAVGQEAGVCETITRWAKEYSTVPVLIKLTPNVSDILIPGAAAVRGGADGLALINTIKSIMSVDIENLVPIPNVGGQSTNGGYCGPAVKPIALHMVAALARDHETRATPISGIGGISNWRDALEFILLGATSVQVCTAVMHYGFRIVEDMIEGLSDYMDSHGYTSVHQLVGKAVRNYVEWGDLDLNHHVIAHIDEKKCIECQVCYTACRDGSHDVIRLDRGGEHPRVPRVDEATCVGCNLCYLVCPVPGCISMVEHRKGDPVTWNDLLASGEAVAGNPPKLAS